MSKSTCAGCGKVISLGGGSKPAGEARCRACFFRDKPIIHGRESTYKKRGCRCQECRDAVNAIARAYRLTVIERDGVSPTQKARPAKSRAECSVCGCEIFRPQSKSPRCGRCRNRWHISNTKRLAIYGRDGWTCQFCLGTIDPGLSIGPWSASLDHIVHRSRGGGHDAGNLRAVHRYCNEIRGTKDWLTIEEVA